MARTKKEQTPDEKLELEPQFDQTDSEQDGENNLPDLELRAADSLDPDAPQTGAEIAEENLPVNGGSQISQTGLESEEGEVASDGSQHPTQTDPEPGQELLEHQTDAEGGEEEPPADGDAPIFKTDLEPGSDGAADQTQSGRPASQPEKRQRRGKATAAPEPSDHDDGTNGEQPEDADNNHEQPTKLRMPGRGRQRVVSIDAERTVETDADRLRSDLLDLVESLKSKKILTGTIQGVERLADNPEMSYAVIYHGDFKVIIPVLEAIEEPEDYRDQAKGDVLHYLLNKRLGAEVDYIVKGVDQEHNVVAASRLEAMALKRREYYFRTDREGNYQIYEGIRAEARVVSVIRAGIFVDLFGAECYIPLRELSYQRWIDATAHYQPGQRVLVKVLEVDRSDHSKPRVAASVKQAGENPYEKALKKYAVGNRYVGTVSMVDTTGVFVSLDGGIDCLCTYPKRGRPPRGCRVTVRILGINHESNRIWGVITHMSMAR